MEKRKFTITGITESTWNGKTYYNCDTDSGVKYSSSDPQVKQFVGVSREFDINGKPDTSGNMRYYINFTKQGGGAGGYGGGGKKPFVVAFKDTKEGFIVSSKSILLSYCFDIAAAKIPAGLNIDKVNDDIKNTFKEILPLLELDKLPTTTQASALQAPVPQTHSTLKPVLITILKAKMAKMNFRAPDMIDFAAGMCGIELKYDPAHDDIIWDISESDAHKIIAACGE